MAASTLPGIAANANTATVALVLNFMLRLPLMNILSLLRHCDGFNSQSADLQSWSLLVSDAGPII